MRWLCLVIVLCLFASPAKAELSKKVVLVLIDGLRLDDISQETTPNLWRMQQIGSSGVLNQGDRRSLHAGAYGTEEVIHEQVTGRDLYIRHIGREPQGAIVFPTLPKNAGALGDAVQRAGGRTAALGNSDYGVDPNRPAALLVMNGRGEVDFGDLEAGKTASARHPYGLQTDMEQLYARYQQIRQKADLIALDTGDLARLHRQYDMMADSKRRQAEQQTLQATDQLVGLLLPEVGPNHLLIVLSPNKHPDPHSPPLLPILFAGGPYSGGGVITSPTTKRVGLVAHYDIAPTVVQFFSGESGGFQGRPLQSVASADPHGQLTALINQLVVPSLSRKALVRPWLHLWIGLATVLLAAALWRKEAWLRRLSPFLEVMMMFPLVWLVVPLLHPRSVGALTIYSLAGTFLIFMLLRLVRDPLRRFGWLAGGTALTLMIDLLCGAPMLKQSVFSYDPIAGARYYGIGNEYMGVLIGAALLALNANQTRRFVALPLFVAVIWIFAAPTLGTNAGGAMAATVGCTYWLLHTAKQPTGWERLLIGGAVLVLLLLPSGQQTHIGRAAQQLLNGQFTDVWQIAKRKVELNLHLLRVSAWGKLFMILAAVTLLSLWRPLKTPLLQFQTDNAKRLGVAALAAFLFNDSGVVAAALILLYATVPLALFAEGATGHTTLETTRLGR
jgi:hypothetical protein